MVQKRMLKKSSNAAQTTPAEEPKKVEAKGVVMSVVPTVRISISKKISVQTQEGEWQAFEAGSEFTVNAEKADAKLTPDEAYQKWSAWIDSMLEAELEGLEGEESGDGADPDLSEFMDLEG